MLEQGYFAVASRCGFEGAIEPVLPVDLQSPASGQKRRLAVTECRCDSFVETVVVAVAAVEQLEEVAVEEDGWVEWGQPSELGEPRRRLEQA